MKIILKYTALFLISFLFLSSSAFALKASQEPAEKEKWEHIKFNGTVKSLDIKKRELTLLGPKGELHTIVVSDNVKRLDELQQGDKVAIEFWAYILAEFRKPTAEEEKTPFVVVTEQSKVPNYVDPKAELAVIIKAVVIIETVNLANMSVTIKGPRGNYLTTPVKDKELIRKLKVGDIAVVTYAEALVVSLEKIE